MGDMSTYLKQAIFNEVLRNTNYTPPATVYVRLGTSSSVEVSASGTAYTGVAVTFGAPTAGVGANSGNVDFPEATANWGTVSHFKLSDAATGGNDLTNFKALDASKAINTGDVARFATGELSVTVS